MAKQVKLSAQTRTGLGRAKVRKIKQAGQVPAVIYGAKQEPLHLQLVAREVRDVLAHATGEHLLVDLQIAGGESRLALIQEVQHHPLRGDVLHVDFHAVDANEKITAAVPVETVGEADGVKNYGGLLEVPLHTLEVECLPKDLPDVIRVDVSKLKLNEAIHVRDLQLPEGVKPAVDAELTVVRVAEPTVAVESTEAPSAGPEVIKEKKAEDKEAK